jgi:hypothetical protein
LSERDLVCELLETLLALSLGPRGTIVGLSFKALWMTKPPRLEDGKRFGNEIGFILSSILFC